MAKRQQNLGQLQAELSPSGILEQTLIERIAIALWRQKRLIRAETAYIELDSTPKSIIADVSRELNQTILEADLMPFDDEHFKWCQAVLVEYETINTESLPDTAWLQASAPLTYKQLLNDAGMEQLPPEVYLQKSEGKFFSRLARYCRIQLKHAEQRPLILEVAELVRSKRAILKDKQRDSLSRHQVMLDNELYKAIKALREAQEWRLKSITVIPDDGFVLGDTLQ